MYVIKIYLTRGNFLPHTRYWILINFFTEMFIIIYVSMYVKAASS